MEKTFIIGNVGLEVEIKNLYNNIFFFGITILDLYLAATTGGNSRE